MTTRFDIRSVPLQGGYIAKRCPVRIQNDVLLPPAPPRFTLDTMMRMAEGVDFEAGIFEELRSGAEPDWVFVPAELGAAEAVATTLAAMEMDASLIAGGWLPADESGRRTGKPDLLLRVDDGFVPVDVKNHLTLTPSADSATPVSELRSPSPTAAEAKSGWNRRKKRGDLLQLAHYRRMLEACDQASTSPTAGIIGKERLVVWYDLDEPMWQTPAKSDGKKRKLRTTMEVYDFEYSFRLDIAAAALESRDRPTNRLLVEPLWSDECPECPWLDQCNLTLRAGSGDPSLLPLVGYREWKLLRDHGITDRAGVARLSYRTAQALRSGEETSDDRDPVTSAIGSAGFLPAAILNARAVLGDSLVYRLPGAKGDFVPRADIEIDVDMESVNDGVYLWGVLITDRAGTGLVENGYHPFVTFSSINAEIELDLFRTFWGWLTDLFAKAAGVGISVLAYCWYSSAENTQMRRISAVDPELAGEVTEFMASSRGIDLEQVFKGSWITGGSRSLKMVAPLAGHSWSVDDPGGGISMVKYLDATNEELPASAQEEAKKWLLDYNRGDVEATKVIREWLDREGSNWPEVDSS